MLVNQFDLPTLRGLRSLSILTDALLDIPTSFYANVCVDMKMQFFIRMCKCRHQTSIDKTDVCPCLCVVHFSYPRHESSVQGSHKYSGG